MTRPVFLTGLARGGTNLLARMLTAGGTGRIAIHAFQPWFRSLRNAIVRDSGRPALIARFDPEAPFSDGHFDEIGLEVQALLHAATLDVQFAAGEWPALLERMQSRASHDAAYLCPRLPTLEGSASYHAMMDRILALVRAGGDAQMQLAGVIDTWIIDLLPALARAYPEAKFLVVIRDPRAVVASQLKFLETDPMGVGHVLSILRQWRKYVALATTFARLPLFEGRLRFVRFEDEVAEPEQFARDLCAFLGFEYRPSMIDFSSYEDASRGGKWTGNSAFEPRLQGIDAAPAHRWRRTLTPNALAAVEFCCEADMKICGYAPADAADAARTQAFLVEDGARPSSWRTDTGDARADFEMEAARSRMLAGARPGDADIRRAFLSVAYFDLISSGQPLFLADTHAPTTS